MFLCSVAFIHSFMYSFSKDLLSVILEMRITSNEPNRQRPCSHRAYILNFILQILTSMVFPLLLPRPRGEQDLQKLRGVELRRSLRTCFCFALFCFFQFCLSSKKKKEKRKTRNKELSGSSAFSFWFMGKGRKTHLRWQNLFVASQKGSTGCYYLKQASKSKHEVSPHP